MLTIALERLTDAELEWLIRIISDHPDQWGSRITARQLRAVILRDQP